MFKKETVSIKTILVENNRFLSPSDSLTGNDSSSHEEGRLRPRPRLKGLEKPTVVVLVPSEMRASIAANRSRYERYLRHTATHVQGTFDPWKLVEE